MRSGRRTRAILVASILLLASERRALGAAGPGRNPAQPEAYYHYSLAQQMILERDYINALEQMENATRTDSSPSLLLELAQLKFSLSDLAGASVLAERIVAADPGMAPAQKLLGDIHLRRAREGGDAEAQIGEAIERYRAALRANPADGDSCRALTELYYHTGRLKEAGETILEFGSGQPLDPALSLLLGKVYARTGRAQEAEKVLSRLVARSPGNLEAADALAAVLEYGKKYDEAIALYTDLLERSVDSVYLHGRIGSLHLLAGRNDEAIPELLKALEADPGDSRSLLSLAQAYEGAGRIDEAIAACDRLIRKEPANLEARFQMARLRQKDGEVETALAQYREIIELANGRGAVSDREAAVLALTFSQIGILQLEGRRYGDASESFVEALNSAGDPGPELFLLLARAQMLGGKPDEARRVAVEAERRFPDDLDAKVFSGEILIATGKEGDARQHFKALIEEAGGSSDVYARVSEAFLRQKRYAEADAVLKEATGRHPGDDALLFARGAALERLGKHADAERLLARAIRVNPKNAMALNYLGYMLADRGVKLTEAVGYVERALQINPKSAAYLDSLGWVRFRMGLYSEAEKHLRAALRYDASDPTIHEHLGDLLRETGRQDEAVREWQAALASGHEEPERVRKKILKIESARPVTP
jgi:tetratricopeptide (TPR) repeat protein